MLVRSISPAHRPPGFLRLPFYASRVSAGFPSPAEEHLEGVLDLNDLMISRPNSTFFVRVQGDSMNGAGIYNDDILVVDRAAAPKNRDVVLAVVDGEFTVKRWIKRARKVLLVPENPNYPEIDIENHQKVEIWGVVTFAIHPFRTPTVV